MVNLQYKNSRPEVFSVKRCSLKLRKIHRKTHVPGSKKETLAQVFSCEFFKIFKKNLFQ